MIILLDRLTGGGGNCIGGLLTEEIQFCNHSNGNDVFVTTPGAIK